MSSPPLEAPSPPARVMIHACATCGGAEPAGARRGERLIALLQRAARGRGVAVQASACLWACKRSCAVHIASPSKVSYLLCELQPTTEVADALVTYAASYRDSADGAVPYKQWPEPLKGHFLCRVPAARDREETP